MGLTQYHHGIPFVVAVSFVSWLASGFNYSCFSYSIAPDYVPQPDDRFGGCDTYFTGALRTLGGDTDRKPFYDVVYDTNFSIIWLFGIAFIAWYLARRSLLQRSMTGSRSRFLTN
jgi:hypothetical protein